MSSQRLSRKEIKHDVRDDAFRHGVEASYDYVLSHRQILLLIVLGVVVLSAGVFGYRTWRDRREAAADELLGEAIKIYDAPVVPTGAKPDDPSEPSFASEADKQARARPLFDRLRHDYSRTGGGAIADVYLGRILLQRGDTAGARALWQGFLGRHGNAMLAAGVRLSLLDLDRQSGKGEQVVQQLRAALDKDDKPLPEDVLLYQLGVTLEQLGRRDEARNAYQRVATEYPDSPWASRATTKARELAGPAVS